MPESEGSVVKLIRHGDPVQYRPAGEAGTVMLAHYRKQAELEAGSWVYVGGSGRAEVASPNGGSTAILFGLGAVRVGNVRLGPWLALEAFDRARLMLVPGEQVEMPGGALLEVLGEDNLAIGPFLLDQADDYSYRVHNQGIGTARIKFREEVITLAPSERLVLGRLDAASGGTAPLLARFRALSLGRRQAQVAGDVSVQPDGQGGFLLKARGGPATVLVQGLVLELAEGEETVWRFPEVEEASR